MTLIRTPPEMSDSLSRISVVTCCCLISRCSQAPTPHDHEGIVFFIPESDDGQETLGDTVIQVGQQSLFGLFDKVIGKFDG